MGAARDVPKNRADYGVIALEAVRKNAYALRFVPKDRADYGEIASAAQSARGQQ